MSFNLTNKTVFISGASSGIGAACAHLFAEHHARLVVCARRGERLAELIKQLPSHTEVLPLILDVTGREAVSQTLATLPAAWQQIDILINNAGLAASFDRLQDGNVDDWEAMIDTNIKGLLYVTHALLPGMLQRNNGHIINIASLAGHEAYPRGNVYCATKHAIVALTQCLKMDLVDTNIRVSGVSPGMVNTEFSTVRFKGDTERAQQVYAGLTPLTAADVADAVLYCATRPAHVNIQEVIILPTAQASALVSHREQ